MKDKVTTLLQNQKSCIPKLKADTMQHICFCPNAHDQLTDFLRDAHQELIDKAKEHNQVINAGWFALPVPPKSLDEDKLVTLLLDKQEYWRLAE